MTADALHTDHESALSDGELGFVAREPVTVAAAYELHGRYVFRCLRTPGVRESHVEDALQDVFVVVNDKLAAFDGRAKLRTWLYAIVIRVARKYRARQLGDARGELEEQSDPRDAERALLSRDELQRALVALSGLDDDKREVFVLAEIEQMSAVEIASVTEVPVNTVYSRLRAARFEFERRVAHGSRPPSTAARRAP
jgi:RNA polymerase sigma-70 factor, ECF subfamily